MATKEEREITANLYAENDSLRAEAGVWKVAHDDLYNRLTHLQAECDTLRLENQQLRNDLAITEAAARWGERSEDELATDLAQARERIQLFDDRGWLEAQCEALRGVVRKHYPTLAGRVIALQNAGEDRAAAEWDALARDFYNVALDQTKKNNDGTR
jgi:hypothetical protein